MFKHIKSKIRNVKKSIKSFRKSAAAFIFDKRSRTRTSLYMSKVKSILFLRNDNKIGDMVISTLLFREIKIKYPRIKIIVLCGGDNKDIIKYNPYVDKRVVFEGNLLKKALILKNLRSRKIDVLIDFFPFRPRPSQLMLLRAVRAAFLIGFHKQSYNIYNKSIECDRNELHISQKYKILLNALDINPTSLKYDIFLGEKEELFAKNIYSSIGLKTKIIINPFAASKHRSFSISKLKLLIDSVKRSIPNSIVIILAQEINYNSVGFLEDTEFVYVYKMNSVLEASAVLKYADYIVSPDTAAVHIAAVFDKKMVSLYLDYSNSDEKTNKIWAPNYNNAIQVSVDTRNGLLENDIKNIENEVIVKELEKLMDTVKSSS